MTVFCMKSKELAVFRKNCLISGWKLLNFWPKSQATNWVAYQKNVYCCWCCRCCCYLLLLLVIGGALQFKIKWEHIQPQNSSSIRKISGKTTKEMRTFRGHFRLKKMFKSPAPRQIFTDSSKKGVYIGVCSTLICEERWRDRLPKLFVEVCIKTILCSERKLSVEKWLIPAWF